MNLKVTFTSFSLCLEFIRICKTKNLVITCSYAENLKTYKLYIFCEIAKTKVPRDTQNLSYFNKARMVYFPSSLALIVYHLG